MNATMRTDNISIARTPSRDWAGVLWKNCEIGGGIIAGVLVVYLFDIIVDKFSSSVQNPQGIWSVSNFHSGLCGWASIQAGVLFSLYTFIGSGSMPFIQAIKNLEPFKKFKNKLIRTAYITLLIAVISFVFGFTNVTPEHNYASLIFTSLWLFLITYALLSFINIMRLFQKLEKYNH